MIPPGIQYAAALPEIVYLYSVGTLFAPIVYFDGSESSEIGLPFFSILPLPRLDVLT